MQARPFSWYLCVLDVQQVAEGRQDALVDDVRHLLLVAADGQVADRPRRLLLRLELALQRIRKVSPLPYTATAVAGVQDSPVRGDG